MIMYELKYLIKNVFWVRIFLLLNLKIIIMVCVKVNI